MVDEKSIWAGQNWTIYVLWKKLLAGDISHQDECLSKFSSKKIQVAWPEQVSPDLRPSHVSDQFGEVAWLPLGGCLTCLTDFEGCLTCLTDLGGCLTCLTDFGGLPDLPDWFWTAFLECGGGVGGACLTCLTVFGKRRWEGRWGLPDFCLAWPKNPVGGSVGLAWPLPCLT